MGIYRHVRVLLALARAFDFRRFSVSETVEILISYDAMCILNPNMKARFSAQHPKLAYLLENARKVIPVCHVRNHKEYCWYVYGSAYMSSVGHFTGETAEYVWPFLNGIGGQTRQMTNGHRQDTIIRNLNDWNWRKTQRMGKRSLTAD
jgi:hypothetical protein